MVAVGRVAAARVVEVMAAAETEAAEKAGVAKEVEEKAQATEGATGVNKEK